MEPISAEQLTHNYYPIVLGKARQLTGGDTEEARDLAQETFWKALRALPNLQKRPGMHAYGGWLITILTRTWIDWQRKKNLIGFSSLDEDDLLLDEDDWQERIERHEQYEQVRQVLAQLSPEQRQILILRAQGISVKETMQRCGLAHLHVDTQYKRAQAVMQTARKLAVQYR